MYSLQHVIQTEINQFFLNIAIVVLFMVMIHKGFTCVSNWYNSVEDRFENITKYLTEDGDSVSSCSSYSSHSVNPEPSANSEIISRSD